MPEIYTDKILTDPNPSWLDGDVMFYMRSRNWFRRRRDLGWLLTYRPEEDTEGLGPQFPTWNVSSVLIHPDGMPYRRLRSTPQQIGWIGLRPCTLNSLHSAKLETREMNSGPESDGLYLHSFTAENVAAGILTAAGRALGHSVLCGPDEDVGNDVAIGATLEMLGYTPNTTDIVFDGGGLSDLPDVLKYGALELLLNEDPPVREGLHFPALRPYGDKAAYRLTVYQDTNT